jgi:hypothetical protein
MAAFGAGVVAILVVSVLANSSQGIPVDSFGSIFTQIHVTVLGIELGRYELNTLTGVGVSAMTFFVSSFFNERKGQFVERITSLERDLRTPAHDTTALMDIRGARAYMFAGRLAVVIGGLLILLAIPTAGEGGILNIVTGVLSIGLGILVVYLTRRMQRRYAARSVE